MNWRGIVIHHSAGPDTDEPNWEGIKDYHVNDNEWSDIGYHALAELIGEEYKVIDGRPLTRQGAHARGKNSTHLGICFVGNYSSKKPAKRLLKVGAKKVVEWAIEFNVRVKDIVPHWKVGETECPGKKFSMEELLDIVKWEIMQTFADIEKWDVAEWQQALDVCGFDAGPIDGQWGPKTSAGVTQANDTLLDKDTEGRTPELRQKLIERVERLFRPSFDEPDLQKIAESVRTVKEELLKFDEITEI